MDITSFFYRISIYEWIIIGLYLTFFIVQLIYYLYLFRKPYQHLVNIDKADEDMDETNSIGISVIITAKNEAKNLKMNLTFILNQDYPNFQVVVVDNGSTDNTRDVLDNFKSKHANLYITFIPIGSEKVNDKKLALTVGIKAAKHDILLFTEPDTKPLTKRWVYEYAKAFNTDKKVVLGSCQLEMDKTISNKFILFDNLFLGIKYLSLALIKRPYMGIGRNMAFRKNLFFENKGFSSILNIEDGEDNVFINKIATKENVAVLISAESRVVSNVVDSFSIWRNIKTRYLTTQKHISLNVTRILKFEVFSRFGFYLLFATLSIIGIVSSLHYLLFFAILLFLIRYFTQIIVINKNSKLYNAGSFYLSLPLFDFLAPIVDYIYLNHKPKKNRR